MNLRTKVLSFLVVVGSLAFLLLGVGSPSSLRHAQSSFLGMLAPFLRSGSTLERKFAAFREGLKSLEELENERDQLRTASRELNATNQTLRGMEAENNRLRRALGYKERAVFKLMPARIIGREISTWFNQVVIDRGSDDGLRRDLPVLTEDGLVGKTTVVSEKSSIVVLISDENCKVGASVEGSREQGIARGERTSSATMPLVSLMFLSKQAALKPGQKVMTSGAGGVFPAGIQIGVVQEFRVRELDGAASLIPSVDLTTLQDVFVVVSDLK